MATPLLGSTASFKRNATIDVLRFFAIFFVLIHHLTIYLPDTKGAIADPLWLGVDLFFVLSGFLVSGLIFSETDRTGSFSFFRFFVRRGFKIYPGYYAMFLFWALMYGALFGKKFIIHLNVIFSFFFFQNYSSLPTGLEHTWSLAIEEHFYVLLGIFFPFVYRRFKQQSVFIAAAVVVAVAGYRIGIAYLYPDTHYFNLYSKTHFRIDSLMLGVVLQLITRTVSAEKITHFFTKYFLYLLGMSLLLLAPSFVPDLAIDKSRYHAGWGFTGIALAFVLIMGLSLYSQQLLNLRLPNWLRLLRNAASKIGKFSYGIYLWHILIFYSVNKWIVVPFHIHWFLAALLMLLAAGLAGVIVTKAVEDPFLKLRDKVLPSRSASVLLYANKS